MNHSTIKHPEHSNSNRDRYYQWIEIVLSLIILLFLMFFSYTEIFLKPDLKITINWSNGIITNVESPAKDFFQIDDHILTINGISLFKIKNSINENPIIQTSEGEMLEFVLIRDGKEIQVDYPKPPQSNQILLQIVSGDWILPYPFFVAGIITVLFIRPRTLTRTLLILLFYSFAIWISAGLISPTGYWASSTIMRVVIWLSVPIAFHLHWRFPTPFKFKKQWIIVHLYALFSIIAIIEIFTVEKGNEYMVAFIGMMVGSFTMLTIKYFHFKEYRKILKSILFAYFLAVLPLLLMVILMLFDSAPANSNIALLGLTAIPGFYFYSAYRLLIKRDIPRINIILRSYSITIIINFVINFSIILLPSGLLNPTVASIISFITIILISMTGFGVLLIIPALANDQVDLFTAESYTLRLSANRAAAFVIYLILITCLSLALVSFFLMPRGWQVPEIIIASFINVTLISLSILFYKSYQKLFDKIVLGIQLPPDELIRGYAHSISVSLEQDALAMLIKEEILPSLLIRESVLVYIEDNSKIKTLFSTGLSPSDAEKIEATLCYHLPDINENELMEAIDMGSSWVRLIAPMKAKGKIMGVWCFGRKDPNEIYNYDLIEDLYSLANQTTLALLNIHQADLLQALYNANVNRQEEEKANFARDLHDVLLPSISYLVDLQENECTPEEFEQAVQRINNMIRNMMSGLRPATLDMGLAIALEELADEPESQIGGRINIQTQLSIPEPVKYDKTTELHLYRIVQQASINALQHAHAHKILISGILLPGSIDLHVEDDGIGFQIDDDLNLSSLIAKHHFGLTNIFERAKIIQAEVSIDSQINKGTTINIFWSSDKSSQYE